MASLTTSEADLLEQANALTKIDNNTLTFTLPTWQLLSLQTQSGNVPELWVSGSKGLYLRHQWRPTDKPETFIFGDIDSKDRKVLLRFSAEIPQDIRTRLSLGRTSPLQRDSKTYPLQGQAEWIDGKKYWRLNAGEQQSVTVLEAGEIVITSMSANTKATFNDTRYRLSNAWDEQSHTTRIFLGGNTVAPDTFSCPQLSRRHNRLQLMTPAPGSRLHVSADRDLLVRINTVTDGRYLFDINKPARPNTIVKQPSRARYTLDLFQPGLHDWSEREQALYQQSLALIDNTYRDGALAAIELLDNHLEAQPSDHIQALRNTLWSRVTRYLDLRPQNPGNALRLRFTSINLPARNVPEASGDFYPLSDINHYALTPGRYRKHFRLALTPMDTVNLAHSSTRFARLQARTGRGETLDFLFDLANETLTPLPPGRAVMDDGQFRTAATSSVFTLPGDSDSLSVQQLDGPPLAITLQLRNSKQFRLAEPELMSLLSTRANDAYQLVLTGIKTPAALQPTASDTVPTRMLKAHLRPLLLQLEQQRDQLIDGLDHYQSKLRKTGEAKSLQILNTLSRQKNWDRLVYASHPLSSSQDSHIRRSAMAARYLALSKLGEHRSAGHFLKLGLFDPDKTIRTWAAKTLAEQYQSNQQSGRINGLYTQLIRNGNTQYLTPLIHNLSTAGREQDALTLALLLPSFDPEHIARLALTQQWHQAFEHTLTRLPPVQQKNWQALRALQFGEFDLASDHWRDAAMPEQASRAKSGVKELALLSSSQTENNSSQWLKWLGSFESAGAGTQRRSVPDSLIAGRPADVIDNATAKRVGYYRVEPGTPTTLHIQGPVQLHLTARGVFDNPGDIGYSAWLNIRNGAQTIHFPLLKLAADNVSDESGQTLSTPTSTRIHLGEGQHQLHFNASKAQLIRLQMEQSALVSGSLPDPQTAALWGDVEPVKANTLRHRWLDRYQQRTSCHPQYQGQSYTLKQLFNPQQRFAMSSTPTYDAPLQGFTKAQSRERAQTLLPNQTLNDLASNPAALLPQRAYPLAMSALWYRDNDIISPSLAAIYVAIARRFGGENHRVTSFYADIAKQYQWQLVDNVQSSAGIRKFEQSGAVPGSSTSRELFLKGAPSDLTRLLDPTEKLSFNYNTMEAAQLILGFQQLVLPGEELDEIRMYLSIDGAPPKYLSLPGNGRKRSYKLNLEPGPHQITFRLLDSQSKSRVALSILESGEGGSQPLATGANRAYFVADTSTKVRINTVKPAFYRINQRIGERVTSHYHPAFNGRPIVLNPGNNGAAYYRIYQFIENPAAQDRAATASTRAPEQAMPLSPNLALNWLGDVDGYILSDPIEAGWLGDSNSGTWGINTQTGELRQSDEDRGGGITPLYTQIALSYRRYFEDTGLYTRTDLLRRTYTNQLDTMSGIRQWFDWYPETSNWSLAAYGHYYQQDVRERQGKTSNDVLYLRAEANHRMDITPYLSNRLKVRAFQYWLSLDDNDLAPGASADPNIFSAYKDDHPTGWYVNNKLTLDYWRDNRLYLEGELISNGLGDPGDLDAYGVKIGIDQLYGEFTAGANFHYRWYKNDNDRSEDSETRRVSLYLDWNRWQKSHGLQLGSALSFDFDTGVNAWNLHANWYFNGGDLRHFRPGELKFKSFQNHHLKRETDLSPVWYK